MVCPSYMICNLVAVYELKCFAGKLRLDSKTMSAHFTQVLEHLAPNWNGDLDVTMQK